MSELQGLGAKLSEAERAGVEIVAVSPDPNERSQKVAEGLRLGYRFVADRDLAVARRYGLVHAAGGPDGQDVPRPAMVVLDRDGVVRWFSVRDRKSTRLNSSHSQISYAVFCLKKK